jgi:uncharacterized membrane protein YfcA
MPLLAAAGVAAGAALQSATGFGFSLVAAPLVFAALGPPEAVGLLIVLSVEVNLLTLATERRRPRPLGREAAVIVLWSVPGALAGVAVLRALDPVALQVAVSAGVIATLAARRVAGRRSPRPSSRPLPPSSRPRRPSSRPVWAAPLAGLAAGGLTTSTSTAGPPLLVHLLGRGVEPDRVRDTLTVCFLGLSVIGAVALLATGTDDAVPDATLLAAMVPTVALGHLAGRPVFARLARGGRYEPVLTVVLIVSIFGGLAGATL